MGCCSSKIEKPKKITGTFRFTTVGTSSKMSFATIKRQDDLKTLILTAFNSEFPLNLATAIEYRYRSDDELYQNKLYWIRFRVEFEDASYQPITIIYYCDIDQEYTSKMYKVLESIYSMLN